LWALSNSAIAVSWMFLRTTDVAQLACDKRADDQRQIETHEIVTPGIQGELMRNQYWIGGRERNAPRLDGSHHPDEACRRQQWQ